MSFDYKNSVDFLLENANPSIKLRVKKEILGSITTEEDDRKLSKEKRLALQRISRTKQRCRTF